jgi:hypothetical protein
MEEAPGRRRAKDARGVRWSGVAVMKHVLRDRYGTAGTEVARQAQHHACDRGIRGERLDRPRLAVSAAVPPDDRRLERMALRGVTALGRSSHPRETFEGRAWIAGVLP